MRGECILSVLFLLSMPVFLSLVGAIGLCASSQAIVNFSSDSNAHASFFDGNVNYPYSICFNERFTPSFSGATRICDATRTNGIIGLSALTNAHVEGVLLTNYPNSSDVCYGNLVCTLRQSVNGAVPCLSGEGNMFSVYSTSNAHAAKLGYYTYTLCCAASGYTPICNNNGLCQAGLGENAANCCDCIGNCTVGGTTIVSTGGVSAVYWSNGTIVVRILEQIDNSYVNNSAYLVANVSGATDGSQITFNIYENDTSGPTPSIRTLTGTVQGGRAYVEWAINDADIAAGLPETDNVFEYYFVASYGGASATSSILNVKNQNGPNVAPVVNISSPLDDFVYFVGDNINFTSASFDRDGRITNLQWSIGDAITDVEKGSSSFVHNYTTSGDKIVSLTATDNDGATVTARVVIAIVGQGTNVHTKINNPYQGQEIFNYTIAYNGSGSWVVNINGTKGASCLGGNCPLTIASAVPQTVAGTRGNYASMNFSWTYGSDNFLINSQSGAANVTGMRTYSGLGAKKIELNVSSGGVSSKIYNDFTINEPSGCTADGLFFVDNSKVRWSTLTQTESICNQATPNCCPRIGDYSCVLNTTTNRNICVAGACNSFFSYNGTTAAITLCDHYNSANEDASTRQVQCNNDCAGAGGSTQQLNFIRNTFGVISGYQINNARCAWNASASKCMVQFTTVSSVGTTIPPVEKFSGCREEIISQSECTSDNYQIVEWKSSALDPNDKTGICDKSGTQTVLCGTPVIALPFFTLGNIIAAIILIVLIYLIIYYSKEKKQKGKGKRRK